MEEPVCPCGIGSSTEFHKDDRVVWIGEDGPQLGTLKWIGRIDGVLCVGMEMRERGNATFRGKSGLNLFSCKPGHRALVPLREVTLYGDYMKKNQLIKKGESSGPGVILVNGPNRLHPCYGENKPRELELPAQQDHWNEGDIILFQETKETAKIIRISLLKDNITLVALLKYIVSTKNTGNYVKMPLHEVMQLADVIEARSDCSGTSAQHVQLPPGLVEVPLFKYLSQSVDPKKQSRLRNLKFEFVSNYSVPSDTSASDYSEYEECPKKIPNLEAKVLSEPVTSPGLKFTTGINCREGRSPNETSSGSSNRSPGFRLYPAPLISPKIPTHNTAHTQTLSPNMKQPSTYGACTLSKYNSPTRRDCLKRLEKEKQLPAQTTPKCEKSNVKPQKSLSYTCLSSFLVRSAVTSLQSSLSESSLRNLRKPEETSPGIDEVDMSEGTVDCTSTSPPLNATKLSTDNDYQVLPFSENDSSENNSPTHIESSTYPVAKDEQLPQTAPKCETTGENGTIFDNVNILRDQVLGSTSNNIDHQLLPELEGLCIDYRAAAQDECAVRAEEVKEHFPPQTTQSRKIPAENSTGAEAGVLSSNNSHEISSLETPEADYSTGQMHNFSKQDECATNPEEAEKQLLQQTAPKCEATGENGTILDNANIFQDQVLCSTSNNIDHQLLPEPEALCTDYSATAHDEYAVRAEEVEEHFPPQTTHSREIPAENSTGAEAGVLSSNNSHEISSPETLEGDYSTGQMHNFSKQDECATNPEEAEKQLLQQTAPKCEATGENGTILDNANILQDLVLGSTPYNNDQQLLPEPEVLCVDYRATAHDECNIKAEVVEERFPPQTTQSREIPAENSSEAEAGALSSNNSHEISSLETPEGVYSTEDKQNFLTQVECATSLEEGEKQCLQQTAPKCEIAAKSETEKQIQL